MYYSTMFHFSIPSDDFTNILNKYPSFKDKLLLIETIDIESILKKVEQEYNLTIPSHFKAYYLKQDEIQKDLIRSLHL